MLEEFDLIEENKKLEKEKVEKKKLEKEKVDTVFVPVSSGFLSFVFFDSLLFVLFNVEFEALLVDVDTSGGMLVVF